jgi:hypothetical protein
MRAPLVLRRSMSPAALALLCMSLIAGTTLAGSKTASAVWIDGQEALAPTTNLSYGDKFTVGYSTTARQPWAHAVCYPNDTTVYRQTYGDGWVWGQYFSVYPGGPQPQAFQLIDPVAENWTSGGADCVLQLVKFSNDGSRETLLASFPFAVTP